MTCAAFIELGDFPAGNYLYSFDRARDGETWLRESHVIQHPGGQMVFRFDDEEVMIRDTILEALMPIGMEQAHRVIAHNEAAGKPRLGGKVTWVGGSGRG